MRRISYHWSACLAVMLLGAGAAAQTNGGLELPTLPPGETQPTMPALALPNTPVSNAIPSLPPTPAASNPPLANNVTPAATAGANLPNLPSATGVASAMDTPSEPLVSFGTFKTSLFFDQDSVEEMKKALTEAETQPAASTETVVEKVETAKAPAPATVNDPAQYPVFTLSSILYRGPTDWTVWIGNKKITPRKNTTELKIVGLSATAATFSWTPVFTRTIALRRAANAFVSVDAVKNRLVHPQILRFDDATTTATFTLRPNQSFAAGYMAVFEGTIESPQMAPLAAAVTTDEKKTGPAASIGGGLAQSEIERLAKEADSQDRAPLGQGLNVPIAPRTLFTNPFNAPKP